MGTNYFIIGFAYEAWDAAPKDAKPTSDLHIDPDHFTAALLNTGRIPLFLTHTRRVVLYIKI